MPNWCVTTISFRGGKDPVCLLDKKIREWTDREYLKSDFGKPWLGNICIGSGITKPEEINDPSGYRCRGSVIWTEKPSEEELIVQTETAWTPMVRMWDAVLDKLGMKEDVRIVYTAEEPGMEVYCTNDPDVAGTYVYDICLAGEDAGRFGPLFDCTEEECQSPEVFITDYEVSPKYHRGLMKKAKKKFPEIQTLEDLPITEGGSYISVHEYHFVPIGNLE